MAVVNPGHVLENSVHSAEVARQHTAAMLGAPVALLTPAVEVVAAGGSHGVVGYNDLKVSQNSTPNMTVQVAAGECFIRGTQQLDQGAYQLFNDAAATGLTISAAHATNPRRDLVVAEVVDQAYSGADEFRLRVITGTPAVSPSDPAVPNNALVLARVQVDAAVTSIVDAKITDLRTFATAVGGIHRGKSTTRPNPALGVGQVQYDSDLGQYSYCSATPSTWKTLLTVGGLKTYSTTWSGTLGNGTLTSLYRQTDDWVEYVIKLIWGTTTSHAAANQTFTLPVTPHALWTVNFPVGLAQAHDAGLNAWSGQVLIVSGSTIVTGGFQQFATGTSAGVATNTVPFTWGNTDEMMIVGAYRAA